MPSSSLCATLFCVLLLLGPHALANVEKTIFLAPPPLTLTASHPSLDALALQHLAHDSSELRTTLERAFPNATSPRGLASWFLLVDLQPQQRYELRICWPAIVSLACMHYFSAPALTAFFLLGAHRVLDRYILNY